MSIGFASIYLVTFAGSSSAPGRRDPLFEDSIFKTFGAYHAPTPEMKAMLSSKFLASALGSPFANAFACSKSKFIKSCAIFRRSWV